MSQTKGFSFDILDGSDMKSEITKINDNIVRLTVPYKDIFTTVCLIFTEEGVLLFDTAASAGDADEYIIPLLEEFSVDAASLKYIFISHNHRDHAGGLERLIEKYPDACIVTRSEDLCEKYSGHRILFAKEGDRLLSVLEVITVPGHTLDCEALLDTRSKTLISGDCLQLYGIYGSGNWASNISFPEQHKAAVDKLRGVDIESILTAHDYHPFGYIYNGKEIISKALDACIEPLLNIKKLIKENPGASNEEICVLYSENGKLPNLGPHVVEALRKADI